MDYLDELPSIFQKQSIIALLVKLHKADELSDSSNMSYIRQVAQYLGLNLSETEEVIKNVDDYTLVPPNSEEERMQILYFLLFQMKSDAIATHEEIKLIKEFGFRLGFHENLTTDMIQLILENLYKKVPPLAMVEIIKKYQN